MADEDQFDFLGRRKETLGKQIFLAFSKREREKETKKELTIVRT